MRDGSWKTLFHPFETGALDIPGRDTRALFIGAEPGFRLPEGFGADLTIAQGFRPAFLELERQGYRVTPLPDRQEQDLALVLAGRHRGRNESWIAQAARRLRPGGLLVVAASRNNGADSLRKRVARSLTLDGHLSKHHGIVFWLTRPQDVSVLESHEQEVLVDDRFRTAPGMFSHGRVDAGSHLLADSLPDDMAGAIADFGAGWGYLAAEVARRARRLDALHLYEADYESCEAARRNLAGLTGAVEPRVLWRDVTTEALESRYDLIVMNPPFHAAGHGADPAIGAAMIEAAARGLRAGGRLFMVANAALPYEQVLSRSFARSGEVRRAEGFKILQARR